jgi:hypothetical protein
VRSSLSVFFQEGKPRRLRVEQRVADWPELVLSFAGEMVKRKGERR